MDMTNCKSCEELKAKLAEATNIIEQQRVISAGAIEHAQRAIRTRTLAQEASSRDALEKQKLREELFSVKVELLGLRQQG